MASISQYGWTSLLGAARGGHLDMARLLLDHGADVNTKDAVRQAIERSGPSGGGRYAGGIVFTRTGSECFSCAAHCASAGGSGMEWLLARGGVLCCPRWLHVRRTHSRPSTVQPKVVTWTWLDCCWTAAPTRTPGTPFVRLSIAAARGGQKRMGRLCRRSNFARLILEVLP